MALLICKKVLFYSEADELSFFDFIGRIKGILTYKGTTAGILLHVKKPISDSSLRNLIALFHRYKIEMKQLAQFSNKKNEIWFKNKEKYWYKKIWNYK
jgi:hypothetical protein